MCLTDTGTGWGLHCTAWWRSMSMLRCGGKSTHTDYLSKWILLLCASFCMCRGVKLAVHQTSADFWCKLALTENWKGVKPRYLDFQRYRWTLRLNWLNGVGVVMADDVLLIVVKIHSLMMSHIVCCRKVPLASDSVPNLSESSSLSMALLPSPTPTLDSISTVSCSTTLSQNGTRIFCLQESKLQLNKAAKSLKGSAVGELLKKHRQPPVAEKRNGSGYHFSGPAHISNGTVALSIRSKPKQPGESQGLSNMARYTSIELNLPQVPKGNDGAVLSQTPLLPCGSTEGRKRKSSASERAGKVTKTTAHNEIFQKNSTALLSSAAEPSHSALSRLVSTEL